MRSFKCLLLIVLIVTMLFPLCFAQENEELTENAEPIITADYACVYNIESGKFLYEKSANTIIYPASLVKIMTATLALEHYRSNGDTIPDVTVTETALEAVKGNNIKLKVGEEVSFYDLVAAVVIGGANDATYVLAEAVAGSVDAFVGMMNDKAKELGAVNTQFSNPTGFHSPSTYSTLYDLAKICEWAYRNNDFMKLSSTLSYSMPATNMSNEREFNNSNLLLDPTHWLRHYKEGASGMNVGMTQESGYSLATVYNNDGQNNIVIIVGGKIDGWDYYYYNEVSTLIDYTSVSYEYKKLVSRDEPIHDMKVLYGKDTDHVLLATKNEVVGLFPNDAKDEDFTSDYTIDFEECIAPVKKGSQMGSYNVYYKGELVSTVPLVTQGNVKRDFFLYLSGKISVFLHRPIVNAIFFLVFAILIFALVIAYIVHYYKKKKSLLREREERLRRLNRARRNIN